MLNHTEEMELSLKHLLAELARIDILIQREIQRWQLAGQDPNDQFRGLYVSDAQAQALINRPLGRSWGQTARLDREDENAYESAITKAQSRAAEILDQATSLGYLPRLSQVQKEFDLEPFDVDCLLICLAPTFDTRYERIFGYLQDDITRKQPSVNLVLDLLCHPHPRRIQQLNRFSSRAPLIHHFLVHCSPAQGPALTPLLNHALSVDETLAAWMLGTYQPHQSLASLCRFEKPTTNPGGKILTRGFTPELTAAIEERTVVVFTGPDQAAQQAAARSIAANLSRPILIVNFSAALESNLTPLQTMQIVMRDARLTNALLVITGWDDSLQNGAPNPGLMEEICSFPDALIICGKTRWQVTGIPRQRNFHWVDFSVPDYIERMKIWSHFLDQVPDKESIDLTSLAGQFQLSSGQIRDAINTARDTAHQQREVLSESHLFAAARAHSNPHLSSLAIKIQPRFDWEDIVLPEDQVALLCELVSTVQTRPKVLEEWGVGRKLASSQGVTVLFSGPPGTGKTMAAEVIASELGLDLFKIDLSTIVSKYIGETEKNLERIFNEAETSNAILFFDEADALFGKRSEVRDSHDRYANIEISYLLQRMEAYNGVSILATNIRANLDEAFTRRLQFAVNFPFPEVEDRLRIWRTLFPPGVPRDGAIDFNLLANRFRLAGGNIRNIIVCAAYLAASNGGCVSMPDLLHGARRELQKMGRLVEDQDLLLIS